MNKLLTKIVGVALGATMAVGVGVGVAVNNNRANVDSQVNADDTLVYTLSGSVSTGGNSSPHNSYAAAANSTQSSITWSVTANSNMTPWRLGGKSITDTDRAIYSTTAIDENIAKIEVESGTSNLESVNSLTITVHDSAADAASGDNAIATKQETTSSNIVGSTVTLQKNDNTSWSGKFYRIVYNVTQSTDSNKYIQFVSAKFYEGSSACTHNWVAGTVHAPTCEDQGYTEYSCFECGETKNDSYVDALGHNFVNGVCTRCGAEEVFETTYDFRTNFSSYASSWGTSYSSKTLNGKTQVGGDYAATITLPLATKQTSTITTMPVVGDTTTGDVIHISFELTESGFELGNVSVTFAQWTTKAPTMKLFKGTTATGTALDSGVVGTKNTISATNVGGTTFVVTMNDGGTTRNQVGIQSITITLKAAPVLSSVTTSGQKAAFEYGDTFSYGGTLTAHYTQGKADATVSPSKFKFGTTSSFDADTTGTEITVGTALSHATHDGKYVRVGYSEDSGVTYKWTDAYQISVDDAPAYYMVLDAYTDTGTDHGYKGGVIEIDVTESNLAGNIVWNVTAGSVTGAASDNDGYMATIASVGTLTITATDSGDNTNTHTISFTIIDSLNTVMAASETPHASNLTFTDKANGSGTADDGATYTVTSDGTESTYEEARGIHFGTSNANAKVQYVQLSSSNVASGASNTIKSVVVNASDAQSEGNTASLTVTVGGASFHCSGNTSIALGGQATYTFTGSGSGTVVVRAERSESRNKGLYFKSVIVNYVTAGAESDIANAVGMHLAQKAVIDYAKDFNDTLEDICVAYGETDTTDLSNSWSALETQYTNWFTNSGKSLSSEEKTHAKALFANASSVDRNVTASADELQHMLAKYDWIVRHYEYSDFLNTDAGTGRDPVSPTNDSFANNGIINNNAAITTTVIVISVLSMTTLCGYFLLRKRKEER